MRVPPGTSWVLFLGVLLGLVPVVYPGADPGPSLVGKTVGNISLADANDKIQTLYGLKENKAVVVLDVRTADEFKAGHIPGAKNIPWAQAVNEDGTFKTPEQLKALYEPKGVTPDKEVIAYCRIGERSSHTWFVLKYLLGYPNVRNYDGSWTEWGNLVRTPIEKP